MRCLKWVICLTGISCLIFLGFACSKTSSPQQELAVMDAGTDAPPAELVEEFRTVMDNLSKKCPGQSMEDLKKNIIQGQIILAHLTNKNLKLIEIAQLIDRTIPEGSVVEKCDKINTELM
jgi:hypothetical protein